MQAAKFKAVFFDLDGTLVDTLADIAEAANFALVENGFQPHPTGDYSKMVGNGIIKLAERAADGADQTVIKRIVRDFLWYYDRNCLKNSKPYTGIAGVLDALRMAGVKLFVVSNKPDEQAQKIVEYLFGKKTFKGVYGNKEGRKPKPDPALVLELLHSAGVAPSEALFIGDSDVDIFTAANAGMKSAGVTWGFRDVDELVSAGADYIFNNPDEITETLLTSK